jgi:hypothetical protein
LRWHTATACTLAAVCLVAAFAPAPIASAADELGPLVRYADVGFDPDDRPIDETSCCQQDPDIRSTKRKVWVDAEGRSWLLVRFHSYEPLIGYWTVVARLDSRGDSRADYRLSFSDPGDSRVRCEIRSRSSPPERGRGILENDGGGCRVPLQMVRPTKVIRWRLFSPAGSEGSEPRIDEYAPDQGWYA